MKKRLKPSQKYGSAKKHRSHESTKPSPHQQGTDEQGAIIKRSKGLIKTALVYPNTYGTGMSSLGFQTVYRLANQVEIVACERVFLPDPRQKCRHIKSVETGLSLDRFDIILFSISFENDFLHLVQLLKETGIPLRSTNRNHTHPLVVAGGVACFLNPEPIAPFMDLFLLGEAECLLEVFFEQFQKTEDKATLLFTIEDKLPGAYVPSRHLPILYSNQETLSNFPPATIEVQYLDTLDRVKTTTTITTSQTAFKDTFLIETLKGCPHGCRFCTAGFIYRPPRIYPLETIYQAIDEAKDKTRKVGLVSSAILDHPDIHLICQYARDRDLKLSFSSLRADKLNDQIIQILADSGVKTATIAPEAGSQKMRNIINKKITREEILRAVEKLVTQGIINLKLYFMIGLPLETDQDVDEIVSLTLAIKAIFLETSKKKKKIGNITLSINPFIPKPSTPFQWSAMALESILKHRVNIIRQGLKKTANVSMNFESLREAKHHALLSLGDRDTADIIETAAQHGWTQAMKTNKEYCNMVIYQEKPRAQEKIKQIPPENITRKLLPWNILRHRVSDQFLAGEFKKAEQEKKSVSCPMDDCNLCKICISS
ncbi:MAG: radical SAM protein [Desulfobacteraceae bacterium]|nr:radical SAM protein [Desulfobacteraceae bacterium]